MKNKSAKELNDELEAADKLRKRGYVKRICNYCNGLGCPSCDDQGFTWTQNIYDPRFVYR